MEPPTIETKLAAARTRLILDKPFLGALVLRLPMVAAEQSWCPTTATDARKFYYNPVYIDSLSMAQTQFMLAHEALHCALSHFARRQHRIKHRWDLACDYAINTLLMDDGLTPPPHTHIMPQYLGMTAEEIYPLIDENDQTDTLDQHLYDQDNESGGGQQGEPPKEPQDNNPNNHGQNKSQQTSNPEQSQERQNNANPDRAHQPDAQPDGQAGGGDQAGQNTSPQDSRDNQPGNAINPQSASAPPPLTPEERETLEVQWQQRLAGAAQQAMQSGKMGGEMARLVDHLLQPQLPWRMLLARYMTAIARDDFSYMRPSRREGDAILPSLKSAQVDMVVALDTSGSIKVREMDEFLSEVAAVKGQMRARVTLIPCDAQIAPDGPQVYESWETFACPEKIRGGGGTDFRPVFNWLSEQDTHPALLVYFTDGKGPFPENEPGYPVIWLVKGREQVPWGQRVQLN